MKPRVAIYDTTLRDGVQGEGVSFSGADKLRIAEKLDHFGVDYIEGGWPGSNPKDMEFFAQVRRFKLRHAKIAAFGSTRRAKTQAAKDDNVRALVAAGTSVVTLVGKTWSLHVREIIRTTPEENRAMIADTVKYFKSRRKTVIYDAEHFFDGYKDDPRYALATLIAAQEAGADVLCLCDTNGGTLPHEIAAVVRAVKRELRPSTSLRAGAPLGIHTHNDCGLGVANAIAAVEAGCVQVQGTINGYGERVGNCNMTSLIPNLQLKLGYRCVRPTSLQHLRELSLFVDDLANIRPNIKAPFVGASAFAHKGGIHVNAVQKNPRSYEHIMPEAVGNRRRVLIGELSGQSNVLMKAHELGVKLAGDSPEVRKILAQLKALEHRGYEFEAADASFQLLVHKVLKRHRPFFEQLGYRITMDKEGRGGLTLCEASVKIRVDGQTEYTVAEGDGPVNALDRALREALQKFYPAIRNVRLVDFKVRILDSKSGTAASTRVLIESTDGRDIWGTVGVSDNLIEASWEALVDSVEYKLLKDEKKK